MTREVLKIAHLIPSLDRGGAEVLLAHLLPRLAARSLQVDLVTLADTNPLAGTLTEHGIRIDTLKHKGGRLYRLDRWVPTTIALKKYIQIERPKIVHSHLYMSDILARLVSSPGTMMVSTLHSVDPWWEQVGRLRWKAKTYLDGCLARLRGAHLIAVSRDVATAACRAFGVDGDRIRVIYNGIDLKRFSIDPSRSFPRDPFDPCLIQIGRIDEPKRCSVALEAFPRVLETFPKARLLFVGDGPLRASLENRARRLGIGRQVEFLGIRSDIPSLLQRADLFWMPSRFEGLPIACLEAMACGLPTVTTNVVGLREVAVEGVTGLVVPLDSAEALAQASLRILKDADLARRMGIAGRQRAEERFSIEKTADEYVRAYEDIIEGRW